METTQSRDTFYITVRVGQRGENRFARMATSAEAARAEAEAEGHTVLKVRRMPSPAGMGARTFRRF